MLGVWFWVLVLIFVVLGGYSYNTKWAGWPWGGSFVLLLLILLLGFKVFGNPLSDSGTGARGDRDRGPRGDHVAVPPAE